MAVQSTSDINWYEMKDVIYDVHGNTGWTMLWFYETCKTGENGKDDFSENHLRIRTLFAHLDYKDRLLKEPFSNFDPDDVRAVVDEKTYCRPDTYYFDSRTGLAAGGAVFGFLRRGIDFGPFISQDLVVALRLVRQGDKWIRPEEGDAEVIRLERDGTGKVRTIKIKTEILKDYLCARNMGLYVEEFRHREAHLSRPPNITWTKCHGLDERISKNGHYVWKGWVFEHSNRSDWDESFALKGLLQAPAYYRIEGQLWKQFWVEPASESPRVAGLVKPLEFLVLPNGKRHKISTLDDMEYGHVYLFFDPVVIQRLQDIPQVKIKWESRDVFSITFPEHSRFLCGLSTKGNVFAISADIARQAQWVQNIWHGSNILPEDVTEYQSHELFQNQMCGEYLSGESPEQIFVKRVDELGKVFKEATGVDLWQEIDTSTETIEKVSRFFVTKDADIPRLAKDLLEALSERMSVSNLKCYINDEEKTKDLKSIRLFKEALLKINASADVENLVSFLRNINEVRQIDSHLMSKADIEKRMKKINLPDCESSFERGALLIEYANQGLVALIEAIEKGCPQ